MSAEVLLRARDEGIALVGTPVQIADLYNRSSRLLDGGAGSVEETVRYDLLEQHVQLCLVVGDDNGAKLALQRLTDKFGEDSARVSVLKAKYVEATEGAAPAQKYLESRPENDLAARKRLAFVRLKASGDLGAYVDALLKHVDTLPGDSETWSELAEVYFRTGNYAEAAHCLEEVTLQAPHAYNVFARLGEVLHGFATKSSNMSEQLALLRESCAHFLRAAELCPSYVRAWVGVHVASSKVQAFPKLPDTDVKTYERLQAIARERLQHIVDARSASNENMLAAMAILKAAA